MQAKNNQMENEWHIPKNSMIKVVDAEIMYFFLESTKDNLKALSIGAKTPTLMLLEQHCYPSLILY